jgi:acyl carrier protein
MISEQKVINIVSEILQLENGEITSVSSSENTEEWDSLNHLSILISLDQWLDGQAGKIPELATATSIKEILTLLNKNIDG